MLEGRLWHAAPPAPPDALVDVRRVAPVTLPDSYLRLLSFSNGGEGPLPVNPYNLCLDSCAQVIEAVRTENYGQPEFDGFLIFGGNGADEYLAFDLRGQAPWPVVTIDMIAGRGSAEQVAKDFDSFLGLIGCHER